MPETLPVVMGDRDELYHVLTNLVVNAQQALLDAPKPRCIDLTATVHENLIEIGVADNGPGVPQSIQGRIFDPILYHEKAWHWHWYRSGRCQGALPRHMVGSLVLDMNYQEGARFILRLPAVTQAEVAHGCIDQGVQSADQAR